MLTPNKTWPHPLHNMGLKLLSIEETFNVGTQGKNPCNPDVMCLNFSKSNVLLLECKSGKNIEQNQLETYLMVSTSDVDRLVTVDNPEEITIAFAYVGQDYSSLRNSISKTLSKIRTDEKIEEVPTGIDLLEATDQIIKAHSVGNYDWDEDLITGIEISQQTFPVNFYPFSNEDDSEYILGNVIRTIIHLIAKKESITPDEVALGSDEITQDLFHPVYAHISTSKKRELLRLVDNCFKSLLKEKKLKNKIYRLGIKDNPISFKITEGILEDLTTLAKEIEEGLTQTGLDDFFEIEP